MSSPLTITPKIYMNLGRVKSTSARAIKFAIYQSVLRALTKAVAKTVIYLELILPESRFRKPPYPSSYHSERLSATAIHVLKKSLQELKSQGFKSSISFYSLLLDYPASYTEFVTAIRGVRWSKPSTQEDFVRKSHVFLIKTIREELNIATVQINNETVSLSKFVSSRSLS